MAVRMVIADGLMGRVAPQQTVHPTVKLVARDMECTVLVAAAVVLVMLVPMGLQMNHRTILAETVETEAQVRLSPQLKPPRIALVK